MTDMSRSPVDIGSEAVAINAAFDATGVKFSSSNADVLAKFNREVTFDESGQPFAVYDQSLVPLKDALTRYAYDTEGSCDRRTLPRTGAGTGRPGAASKSDYTTTKQKVDFIAEHGADAWEKLPLTNTAGNEIQHREDWYALPASEKVRRLDIDPDAFAKLRPRPTNTPRGSFINHEALDKLKAIRPGR